MTVPGVTAKTVVFSGFVATTMRDTSGPKVSRETALKRWITVLIIELGLKVFSIL